MWYVIQVYSGQEKCIKELIEQYGDCKNIEDCKIPSYVKLKKQKEAWYPETKVLFPGYLFIKTQNIEELYQQLKSIPKMTKLLGVRKEITPISAEEERFLLTVGGDEMIIDLSKGVIEHGKVKVLSGPLQGMEGCTFLHFNSKCMNLCSRRCKKESLDLYPQFQIKRLSV